jgi:hypothetical protein
MAGWKNGGLSEKGSDHIKCPFYKAHSSHEIKCESHIPDTRVVFKFDSEKKKNEQQHIFCEGCYQRCEHYIAVMHFRWPQE